MGVEFNINALLTQLGKFWTIILIIAFGIGVWFAKGLFIHKNTQSQSDCTFCEKQVSVLTNALIEIKTEVNKAMPSNPTSFNFMGGSESISILFPRIDTLPKKKKDNLRKTNSVPIQYQLALKRISHEIDSVLKVSQQQPKHN